MPHPRTPYIRMLESRASELEAENTQLRAALKAARNHIGNGYQPPELIDQIDAALQPKEEEK